MKVELQRQDLINLCKYVALGATGIDALKNHPFKQAFKRTQFVNGYFYRLSDTWVIEQTDEQLFAFYAHHSPTIKLL